MGPSCILLGLDVSIPVRLTSLANFNDRRLRRRGCRKCHSQDSEKGGEHYRGKRRGREEGSLVTQRGMQAEKQCHQPGRDDEVAD